MLWGCGFDLWSGNWDPTCFKTKKYPKHFKEKGSSVVTNLIKTLETAHIKKKRKLKKKKKGKKSSAL